MLAEEKVKIGWNICKVHDYIRILRCFKCCSYYHFAKECKKEVAPRKCAGKQETNECRSDTRKCVNCEETIKSFKLENINWNMHRLIQIVLSSLIFVYRTFVECVKGR